MNTGFADTNLMRTCLIDFFEFCASTLSLSVELIFLLHRPFNTLLYRFVDFNLSGILVIVNLVGGGGSSSGSQHSPGGYLPHVGHQNQPQTPTPSSTPVSDMSPQPPHGMSGSPPVVSWDMKPTAPAHHPAAHHPHHHTHPGYMPQYSWYQADANQGLLTIVFQWIPSHCGILGNENADALAKKGSTATYRPVTKSTYYSVKRFIKSTYSYFNKQNLITQSQGKKWNFLHHNPQLIPDLPRKSSVAAFKLATGHDCLAKHLHRIGIYQSPNCPLCNSNQEMDSEHLKICVSVADHDNIFEKYWSARGQMTLLSNAWH
ncbi:hypothetical protein ANN_20924 [Periplaneta americana]|uniref:RNase H type-1 domain-containing protein n=1 Tax=Periplaneta americana TaxID=6978 RepID=A0ABQ8SEQ9_PERAM|nr:hypothetical protein ANN_20924 [Periplaneta americana]